MSPIHRVSCVVVLLTATAQSPLAAAEGPSDRVTLKDGQVVRGEVVEANARTVVLTARRAWVRENLKGWPERWDTQESRSLLHALTRRRERLETWRRDREVKPGTGDRIQAWISSELTRLKDFDANACPLMTVRLSRFDVKSIEKARPESRSLLRLAWRSGFPNPEGMDLASLSDALQGRGFAVPPTEAVSIDDLLPPQSETETHWMARRASTEVLNDPGLRFVRHQGLLLPDAGPGAGLPTGLDAIATLRGLLEGDQADPLPAKLREVEMTGRVGVLLTRLEIAPDLSAVTVEVGLMTRVEPGRWTSAGSRTARVRPEDIPAQAGEALAQDPQVSTAFRVVEALGLGQVDPAMKTRSLLIGAAVQRALGTARSAALADLNRLALPVLDTPAGPGGPVGPGK